MKKVKKTAKQKMNRHKMTVEGSPQDIIKLIEEDHKPLKKFLQILKNTEIDVKKRQKALIEFGPLLLNHARAEEQILYTAMERLEGLKIESYEGVVEHRISEELLEDGLNEEDDQMWSAKIKVLAELVEHHLKEEETEMLPHFKKQFSAEERAQLGDKYILLKQEFEDADRNVAVDETTDEDLGMNRHLSH